MKYHLIRSSADLYDGIVNLLRTMTLRTAIARTGSHAIAVQPVERPERAFDKFCVRLLLYPRCQIISFISIANQTPINKPITVAPIAARYAALHNRAAMMGDDLAHVLVKFRSHFAPF